MGNESKTVQPTAHWAYSHECMQQVEGSDHSPLVSCFLDYIFLGPKALEEGKAATGSKHGLLVGGGGAHTTGDR